MINIALIIRLDPEGIIVAPMRIPRRSNFVVESSGNLVARRRRLRAEGKVVGLDPRFFLFLREGLRIQ
jgi:hypothetical protein